MLRSDVEQGRGLDTPCHGSGEPASRDGYELVNGMMLPRRFFIARPAGGRVLPFWEGRVTRIRFVGGD